MQLFRARTPRHALPRRNRALSLAAVATGTAAVLAFDLTGAGSALAQDRSFPTMLRELRECESGNSYGINSGNGYYGAYQFNLQTWRGVGGTGYPHQNPPHVQDEMATRLYESRGWSPWPSCSRSRGLHATRVERPWAGSDPQGNLDAARGHRNGIEVRGWAFDRDANHPIEVHAYVDGRGALAMRADQSRPDVARTFGVGEHTGFSAVVPATPGAHSICFYGINAGGGGNVSLGCVNLTVPRSPIGSVDEVTVVDGGVRVRGWTLDLDAPRTSTEAHVHVDGRPVHGTVASAPRPDVARAYGVPEARGYDVVVPAGSEVCTYAIDTSGRTDDTRLACEQPSA